MLIVAPISFLVPLPYLTCFAKYARVVHVAVVANTAIVKKYIALACPRRDYRIFKLNNLA